MIKVRLRADNQNDGHQHAPIKCTACIKRSQPLTEIRIGLVCIRLCVTCRSDLLAKLDTR